MKTDRRFADAIDSLDAANREDPRTELVNGEAQPRELLFSKRVYDWVCKLVGDPSEELLLAARAHTIRRWMIPRDRFPKTTVGYHAWRNALAQFHAKEADAILRDGGYSEETVRTVRSFITKTNWPANREACALEDADCLVFLETKLQNYVDEWDESKALRIIRRTHAKMTPEARRRIAELDLGKRERELLQRATLPTGTEPIQQDE